MEEMSRPDCLSDKIDEKLRVLSPNHSTCSIFKVPGHLRRVNERAYEPEILSIGPYHRGKDNLKMMEEHKKRYLKKLLERTGEFSVARYVRELWRLEERARQCYDQSVSLNKVEFVEMLLLDGCFIVELIRNIPERGDNDDPVFNVSWINFSTKTDMLLVENQLPFFVLQELFTMTIMPNQNEDFLSMTSEFFWSMFPVSEFRQNNTNSDNGYKHLLDIVYRHNCRHYARPAESTTSIETNGKKWKFMCCAKELKEAGIQFRKWKFMCCANELKEAGIQCRKWKFMHCAKELKEAGIQFKKNELKEAGIQSKKNERSGIYFENGKMFIPSMIIGDETESLLRNFVAYEQCSMLKHQYITDYTILMDCLINTQEDVQILRHSGIIEQLLGDDDKVCTLFNELCTNVIFSDDFRYAEVFERVKEHCERRRNVWLAKLRHDYFNTPWAWISFLAAVALLLLTLVQTVFTVMSHFKQE